MKDPVHSRRPELLSNLLSHLSGETSAIVQSQLLPIIPLVLSIKYELDSSLQPYKSTQNTH
jgi:hypothetical protein